MAERFARGGRLIAFGRSPAARSDARHVAVEFVHPVIVGKRALPGARRWPARAARWSDQVALARRAGRHRDRLRRATTTAAASALARERGCLTLAFAPGAAAEWEFEPPCQDASIRQELVETLYHVLWELVHVFFDHRGLLEGRDERAPARHRRVELPLPVPRRGRERPGGDRGGRAPLGARQGGGDRRAARADAQGQPRRADRRGGGPARRPRRGRAPARPRQRRLRHRRHGRGGGLPLPARPALAPAARDGPDGGPGDPDRDRERHRHRGDLLATGDRPRPRRATPCSRSPPAATRRT